MAVRTDFTFNWLLSPRLIRINAPSSEVTQQDLLDTARVEEARLYNLIYDSIIASAGKEDLGGGQFNTITNKLLNAQVLFESRVEAQETGLATLASADGLTLTDIYASFITNGVTRGANIINWDTQKQGTVLTVDSENQVTLLPDVVGGIDSWSDGDSYSIVNEEQMELSGGNLVAVDTDGETFIDAVFTTFGTQVLRTLSSSGTLLSQSALVSSIETLSTDVATLQAVADLIRKLLDNDMQTNPATGEMTIADDGGTLGDSNPLRVYDLFEDAEGTTPYQGDKAERRVRKVP